VDEVVIVDTGSTDRTREVAARYGARVFDFPWCDSFAAARNETLRHATGDWIFWLDADDRLDGDNRRKLRELFAGLDGENVAYAMKCLCLPDPVTKAATAVDHIRLFRNRPDVRWQWRVHEQILPAVRRSGGDVRWSDVIIRHVGYQDPALRRRKLDRDLRLLLLEGAEHPDDPELLFSEGTLRHQLGDGAGAEACLLRLLRAQEPVHFASIDTGVCGYKARHNLAVLYQQQGRAAEAEAHWQAAVAEQPDFLPAWLGLADLYLAQQRWPDLDRVVGCLQDRPETAVLRGRAHLARREFGPAREILRAAIAEQPRALWPRVILSHVLLQEGCDWDAAEQALLDVLSPAPEHAEARRNLAVLRRQLGRAPGAGDGPGPETPAASSIHP
jgi:tetratricopeptide (TPR) repeat protein